MSKSKKCYLCQHHSVEKAFSKLGWNIDYCKTCKLYTLDFKGSYNNFIRTYYDKKFFTGSKKRAGYCNYEGDRKAEKRNMQNYLKGIQIFKKSGSLLDVGCATGLFMQEAKKERFVVDGLDVSDYAVNIAKKHFGNRVKRANIENVDYKGKKFDVITMFDVLEHLNNPKNVLKKTFKILTKDGILVINTGDTGSLLAKIQGKHWHFFIPPQHFFYFSQNNLSELLKQSGFRIIRVDRKGKWVSIRYLFHLARQIQNDIIGHLGFALVGNNIIGKIPVYLNLFDNITVYAVKEKKGKHQ